MGKKYLNVFFSSSSFFVSVLRMAHDAVDTNVRSRRLNGVSAAAIDKTEQNKSNGNGVSTLNSSPNESTFEVKSTTTNTNNNYRNDRKEADACNGNAITESVATATAHNETNRLSCMRGSLLHDNVPFIPKFRWPDLIVQIFLHTSALYGLLFQFYSIKFYTLIWCKLNDVTERSNERAKYSFVEQYPARTHF